jgi:hypothetical protein
VSTKSTKQPPSLQLIESGLDELRGHLVELEAVAHAAERALEHLPYVPPPESESGEEAGEQAPPYTDERLGPGRLQALVAATASSSRSLLQQVDHLLASIQELRSMARVPIGNGNGNGSSRASEDWRPQFVFPTAQAQASKRT